MLRAGNFTYITKFNNIRFPKYSIIFKYSGIIILTYVLVLLSIALPTVHVYKQYKKAVGK